MTLIELKKSIHEKVDHLDDVELLELINDIANKTPGVFQIPEYMKAGFEQGQRDIQNGNTFTLTDFEEKYNLTN